jgi:hypothetical protein
MNTLTDGVSCDVSSKTLWDAVYDISWPEIGSDNIHFNAVHSSLSGAVTVSTLSLTSTDSNSFSIKPVFTNQTDTQYTLSIYNGPTLVANQSAIGPSANAILIRSTPYTRTLGKSFTPQSLVMTGTDNQTTFLINPGPGTCSRQMIIGTGTDSITAPNGITYAGTRVQLTETISTGVSSFDHLQVLGNSRTMKVDTVAVN